jgi:hypothetical protein
MNLRFITAFYNSYSKTEDYSNISVLVSSLKQKDKKAFIYLYDNCGAKLYGVICNLANNKFTKNHVEHNFSWFHNDQFLIIN